MSRFSEVLSYLIFEQNADAKAFAAKIGVSPTCITRYLRDDRFPSIEMLVLLADYFECSADYLLGLEENKGSAKYKKCPKFSTQFAYMLDYFDYNCYKLSEGINIHQSTLYAWKNGKRVPTAENVIKLAEFFDCRVDFILGRES